MKKYILYVLALTFFANYATAQSTPINTEMSSVTWTGAKVTGSHTGTIDIASGALSFDNGRLSGGEFTIDMTSLTNTDLGEKMQGRLVGHLMSDDFFGVETYPTAKLVITKVGPGEGGLSVTGDLTIKGKTAPITFTATVMDNKATANISVDRTLYDVKYGSGKFFDNLGDKMIDDNFDLVVNLAF